MEIINQKQTPKEVLREEKSNSIYRKHPGNLPNRFFRFGNQAQFI